MDDQLNDIYMQYMGAMQPERRNIVRKLVAHSQFHIIARIAAQIAIDTDCNKATDFCELVEAVQVERAVYDNIEEVMGGIEVPINELLPMPNFSSRFIPNDQFGRHLLRLIALHPNDFPNVKLEDVKDMSEERVMDLIRQFNQTHNIRS